MENKKSLLIDNEKLFDEVSRTFPNQVPDNLTEKYPTLHWCQDWDFLLIDEGCPEFECCLCYR